MRRSMLVLAAVIALLTMSVTSCSSRGSEFVGQWQNQIQAQGTNMTSGIFEDIEFFKDGTVAAKSFGGGTYSILDDTRLKIEFAGGLFVYTYSYSVRGDNLTLTGDDKGTKSTYVRKTP